MIWRLTLEPRIVEVDWKIIWKEDIRRWKKELDRLEKAGDPQKLLTFLEDDARLRESIRAHDENSILYTAIATLPTAFRVCNDSRTAVMPLYPLSFASNTGRLEIRFNFALDTLYIDPSFQEKLFGFLDSLSSLEMARLTNVAINEGVSVGLDSDDYFAKKYWTRLGTYIDKMTGLKSIFTLDEVDHPVCTRMRVVENELENDLVTRHLLSGRRAELELELTSLEDLFSDLMSGMDSKEWLVEIFERYPNELMTRLTLEHTNFDEYEMFVADTVHSVDWVSKRAKPAWLWRRDKHPPGSI